MGVVGDFTVPAESFALHHALTTVPEMAVEADRLASHSSMEVLPFLWATGGDFETFRQALDDDPTVEGVDVAEEMDGEVLYRIEWADGFVDLINEMVDHHAAIVDVQGRGDQWSLRLRFADEGMVSDFQRFFRETGRTFDVHRLYHPSEPRQRAFGLTNAQYEALTLASTEGYFRIPRATSADELGEMLGISSNAVSQRIRRGCDTLIRTTLRFDDETG